MSWYKPDGVCFLATLPLHLAHSSEGSRAPCPPTDAVWGAVPRVPWGAIPPPDRPCTLALLMAQKAASSCLASMGATCTIFGQPLAPQGQAALPIWQQHHDLPSAWMCWSACSPSCLPPIGACSDICLSFTWFSVLPFVITVLQTPRFKGSFNWAAVFHPVGASLSNTSSLLSMIHFPILNTDLARIAWKEHFIHWMLSLFLLQITFNTCFSYVALDAVSICSLCCLTQCIFVPNWD